MLAICSALGGSAKAECDTLVTNYGVAIAEILAAEMTPSQLCPELKLCPKQIEVMNLTELAFCIPLLFVSDYLASEICW